MRSTAVTAVPETPRAPEPAALPSPGPLTTFWLTVRDYLSLDLRSLALFRVGLGFLILTDLANRWPDLTAFYSDEGIAPSYLLSKDYPASIHAWFGSPGYQVFLHLLACLFAVGVLVGYKTQLMTLLSWFLLLSSQGRNEAVLHGGDVLLRLLAFWGIFLPLGACFSLDALTRARRLNQRYRFFSAGTIALTLQVCFVYWFAAIWKLTGETWAEGTAVYYALSVDGFTTRIGQYLMKFPEVMKWLTWGTLYLERFGPVFLFMPFYHGLCRVLTILAFIGLHAGLGLCLALGNFPPVCWLAWIVLLPPWFWEKVGAWLHKPGSEKLVISYDASRTACATAAAFLRTFLLLYKAELVPLPVAPANGTAKGQPRSWLTVTRPGADVSGFDAVVELVRLSPLFGRLAFVLKWESVHRAGERLFQRFGAARAQSVQPAMLEEQPPPPAPGLTQTVVVLFLIVYVFALNVQNVEWVWRKEDPDKPKQPSPVSAVGPRARRAVELVKDIPVLPKQMNGLAWALGIDQGWGVFAPNPGTYDGWYVIVGTLKNGEKVNLFTGGRPLDEVKIGAPIRWEKPDLVSETYVNSRWRKFFLNMSGTRYENLWPYFADYLCREWDARHQGPEELVWVDVFFMEEITLPPGQPYPEAPKRWKIHYPCPSKHQALDSEAASAP
jgi:hypothetical protein